MYGRIRTDINLVVRGPFSEMSLPNFRNSQYVHNVQTTTAKLDGLYNNVNMPVVYSSAGQRGAFQIRQTNQKNMNLSQIMYPQRMPYQVTP